MPGKARSPGLRGAAKDLNERLSRVKLFLCDVDGILTDASIFIGQREEIKRFHIRDGLGLMMLRRAGIKVGWISNRPSKATTMRARELKIDFLEQPRDGKVKAAESLLARTGFGWDEVCYMGDDIVDLGMLKRAGLAVTVPEGLHEARMMAQYITENAGGHGAVRETVEMILKAQNKWSGFVAEYSA